MRRVGIGEQDSGESGVLPQPEAAAADVDDVAVMQEAVYACGGHDIVAQDLAPVLEALV